MNINPLNIRNPIFWRSSGRNIPETASFSSPHTNTAVSSSISSVSRAMFEKSLEKPKEVENSPKDTEDTEENQNNRRPHLPVPTGPPPPGGWQHGTPTAWITEDGQQVLLAATVTEYETAFQKLYNSFRRDGWLSRNALTDEQVNTAWTVSFDRLAAAYEGLRQELKSTYTGEELSTALSQLESDLDKVLEMIKESQERSLRSMAHVAQRGTLLSGEEVDWNFMSDWLGGLAGVRRGLGREELIDSLEELIRIMRDYLVEQFQLVRHSASERDNFNSENVNSDANELIDFVDNLSNNAERLEAFRAGLSSIDVQL
ncbi:MAG: hypothetical protein FWG65_08400 [Turicibacter sp.]|nr:hypothetical protein [Turicibacter sp.]